MWQEATTLHAHGWQVSIICPTGKGYQKTFEEIDGIEIHRYRLPTEGDGALSYLAEYSSALWNTFRLAIKVRRRRGFDVIHACNPPDFLFLVAAFSNYLEKRGLSSIITTSIRSYTKPNSAVATFCGR
nr:glycosyltransferase [Mycolicibacterium tokaiense]